MFATEVRRKLAASSRRSALRRTPSLFLRVLGAMTVHGEAQGAIIFALLPSLSGKSGANRRNSLPLTPGGIGAGETAFNVLFKLTGISGGAEALLWFVCGMFL